MEYEPKPLDTSAVSLLPELLQLVEQLAENVHETWARHRVAEGWTYGPERNDALKQHPCLVPYADLPESEKEMDRQAAIETLKSITLLGFRIDGEGPIPIAPAAPKDEWTET